MKKEDLEMKNLIERLVFHQAEAISCSIKALAALFSFSLLLGTDNADKVVEGFLDIIKSEVYVRLMIDPKSVEIKKVPKIGKDTVGYRSAKFQEKKEER